MSWKCPECNEIIDELDYKVDTTCTKYGRAELTEGPATCGADYHYDTDSGSQEWIGDPEYNCPNCEISLEPSALIWDTNENEDNEDDKEEEKTKDNEEETKHKIISPKQQITQTGKLATRNTNLICKECNHVIVNYGTYINTKEFNDCPNCGTQNSQEEYQKLLETGHYNTNKPKQT